MDKTYLTIYKSIHGLYSSYSRPELLASRYLTVRRIIRNEEYNQCKDYIKILNKVIHSRRILINFLNKIRENNKKGVRISDWISLWNIRKEVDKAENIFEYYYNEFGQTLPRGLKYNKKEFLDKLLSCTPYYEEYMKEVLSDLEEHQRIDRAILKIARGIEKHGS